MCHQNTRWGKTETGKHLHTVTTGSVTNQGHLQPTWRANIANNKTVSAEQQGCCTVWPNSQLLHYCENLIRKLMIQILLPWCRREPVAVEAGTASWCRYVYTALHNRNVILWSPEGVGHAHTRLIALFSAESMWLQGEWTWECWIGQRLVWDVIQIQQEAQHAQTAVGAAHGASGPRVSAAMGCVYGEIVP